MALSCAGNILVGLSLLLEAPAAHGSAFCGKIVTAGLDHDAGDSRD